jgi:predicted DNA-binding transcriptional regulator YafY
MRADRLIATLLLLQSRGRVTAAEVAAELEVSERTARRDLDALATAGVPVYSQQGRGGGWSLLGGARTDLSGLNSAEARALFMVAGPSSSATPEVKAALRKLVRALPEPFRDDAEAAAGAVVIDARAWGRPAPPSPSEYLEPLRTAVVDGEQVRLRYSDRARRVTDRVVHPLGIVEKGNVSYLVAGTADGLRTFRISRVRGVEPLGLPVERPPGFDLAATWEEISERVERQRTEKVVTARVDRSVLGTLHGIFGTDLVAGPLEADGRLEVEVRGPSVWVTTAQLAGFGARVEVVDPPEAREQLARIGEELVATYGRLLAGATSDRA